MKILIVQLSFLGDIVLSTPVIRVIAEKHPKAELYFLTTKLGSELVKNDPLLKETIIFDKRDSERGVSGFRRCAKKLKSYNFDLAYCLHRSFRTALLLYCSGIKERIGFQTSSGKFLYTSVKKRPTGMHEVERNIALIDEPDAVTEQLKQLRLFSSSPSFENRGYVVMFPSSSWRTKMWFAEGFHSVAAKLIESGIDVILLGSKNECENNAKVAAGIPVHDLTGKVTLGETIAIVNGAKAVVCNDSLGLHIASACKTPTVAIFCATSPEFGFGPWRNRSIIVEENYLSCKPCRRHGSMACPVGTEACMKVHPQRVLQALEELCQ